MKHLIAVLLLVAVACSAAQASMTLEEMEAEGGIPAAVAAYLRAFNAQDEAALREFVSTYRDSTSLARTPLDARVSRHLQMQGMVGALEPVSASFPTAESYELVAYSPSMDAYVLLSFEASSMDPLQFGLMGLRPTEAPGQTFPELAGALSEQMPVIREAAKLPALGVAWYGDGGGPVEFVDGVRNLDTGEPVEAGDRFHYGSITKSMTSCIAARLVDRGLISYETTIEEGLDGVWLHSGFKAVTLEQLLQHRGGVEPLLQGNPEREEKWRAKGGTASDQRRALAASVLSVEPSPAPGTAMSYSNGGYVVVALMLEQASGSSWEELMVSEVFEPLGLESCGLGWPATQERPDEPRGYWTGSRLQTWTGYDLGPLISPAGDAHGSASDLARYGHALATGPEGWIQPETLERMFADPGTGYAMGLQIEEVDGRRFLVHNGSAGTFFAFLAFEPESGETAAVVMNEGSLSNDTVCRKVAQALFDGVLQPR